MSLYALPDTSPLIAYYGDDLTGSTAVMEVTAFAGLDLRATHVRARRNGWRKIYHNFLLF